MKLIVLKSLILSFVILITSSHAARIRSINVTSDLLIPIKTSLGYSTIIEFQEKPVSAILGDQDSFKLEYVGNSITLKPLFHSAKSNLFVYTGFDRFNFSLATASPLETDYVVRIRRNTSEKTSNQVESPYIVLPLNLRSIQAGFTLIVHELDLARDTSDSRAASLLKFSLSSNGESYHFSPASFGLKQSSRFLDLEGIYLDQVEISKKTSSNGVIAILNQQWKRNLPVTLVFAYERKIRNKKQSGKILVTFPPSRKAMKKELSNAKAGLFQIPSK